MAKKRKTFAVNRDDVETLSIVVSALKEGGAPPALLMQVIMALLGMLGILNAAEANARQTFGTEAPKAEAEEPETEEPERVASEDWDGIEMAAKAAKLGADHEKVMLEECKHCAGPLLRAPGDIKRHANCSAPKRKSKAATMAAEASEAAGKASKKSGKAPKAGKAGQRKGDTVRCRECKTEMVAKSSNHARCEAAECHKAHNARRMSKTRAARA